MYPHLFYIPVFVLLTIGGGVLGASFAASTKRLGLIAAVAAGLALLAGGIAYSQAWGHNAIPVQGYGTMILIGFLVAAYQVAHRAPLLGVEPHHGLDIGVYGVFAGLFGARLFDILMNWSEYSPFRATGFDINHVWNMFMLWKGGLVFYGAFLIVIPYGYLYCRYFKIKPLPFLDLCIVAVVIGLAFGRIGCFMNGCCFGKVCSLPWAVQFPGRMGSDSPAHSAQVAAHLIAASSPYSLRVHPTQLYASLAAFLSAGFLWLYWPRRRYDGQILSLAMIMAGATRFFEEGLRADDYAVFPGISSWMTVAQYVAIGLVVGGFALMFHFRRLSQLRSSQTQSGPNEPRLQNDTASKDESGRVASAV